MKGLGPSTSGPTRTESGAKPDIRVRIRAGVVEVQRPQAGIAGTVAIAATEREPLNARPF